ncbi:MAG: Ppx/GppA family phosphatase [Kiritimatiellae bacterium]|nr:Ppx/GppA family phosphatase [Kiritimatiellia bacterium]
MTPETPAAAKPALPSPARPIAVIDVGSNSVRMAVAQVNEQGQIQILDTLQQVVGLGKDTFTKGSIDKSTVEECVNALKSFRAVLQEYQISEPGQVRVVATSAVREASNREAFLDRVYIATGLHIEVLDEAEVNRYTYLSVQPLFESDPTLREGDIVIAEVGGGSTEILMLRSRQVVFSHTYRLGALRLREMLGDVRAPATRQPQIMEDFIRRTVAQVLREAPLGESPTLLLLGGDVRFAARQMAPEWDGSHTSRVQLPALSRFTSEILQMPVEELVHKHHLSFPDAETLGPALLSNLRIAQALKLKHVLVGDSTLRDGLLAEMSVGGAWTQEFTQQIVNSAIELGRHYGFDLQHSERVAAFARELFRTLAAEHQLPPRYELILNIGALLHEIGLFVSNRSHHKHSMYLILNSDLFGLGARDKLLAALVARYHRRATPKPLHEGYATLDREGRVAVAKMAAILRVSDALERGGGRIQSITITREPGKLVITAPGVSDVTLEQFAMQSKGQMFEQVYGMSVLLRAGGAGG